MPSTLFDSAGLAIVAYAQVDGATGSSISSTAMNSTLLANSGVTTSRIDVGWYSLTLSTATGQDPSRDLIFVQPTTPTTNDYGPGSVPYPPSTLVVDNDDYEKQVFIGTLDPTTQLTTALDCDFNILVLRTILP